MSYSAYGLRGILMNKEFYIEKANLLKALSNPVRLCIINRLCQEGEKNVTDFVNCMEVSQSAISQHLAILRNYGIISGEIIGNKIYYSCVNQEVRNLITMLLKE